MGKFFLEHSNGKSFYSCRKCSTCIAAKDDVHNNKFLYNYERGYLFRKSVNITCEKLQLIDMSTGLHYIRNVRCKYCKLKLGLKYEYAIKCTERYKEGMFLLALKLLKECSGFDNPKE